MIRVCLAVAALLVATASYCCAAPSKHPAQPQPSANQQQTAPDQRGTEQSPVVVKILPTQKNEAEARADREEHEEKRLNDSHTIQLNVVTVLLIFIQVIIYGLQSYWIQGNLRATNRAANAADRSAHTAVAVQLPILAPTRIALNREPGVNGPVVGYPGQVCMFLINFINHGATPAELITQCIEWKVMSSLPDTPLYESNFAFAPGVFVHSKQTSPATIQNFLVVLQSEEVEALAKEEKFLWFYGYISFKDFLGDDHKQGWCAKWQAFRPQPDGTKVPLGFVYDSQTPPAYTERT